MSYEKIAAAGLEPASISFYFTMDELFNINSLWSMYKTVHKVDGEGKNMVDALAITEDERDIFTSLLSDGVYDVFNRFLKYTKGISEAIMFDENYTPAGGSEAKTTGVKIVDHEAYNGNYLTPVSKLLEKSLRFYVLREWFSMKDLDDDSARANASYVSNTNELLRHAMQLKKAAITF